MNIEKQVDVINEIDYKFLTVSSPAFEPNGFIPDRYTCNGDDVNPPIEIEFIPKRAKSIVVIVDEPGAPYGSFCHWLTWNLPVGHYVQENEKRGVNGMNDLLHRWYDGPFQSDGIHRYFFRVYALDTLLDLPANCDRMQLDKALRSHIVGYGLLVGKYKA